MANDQKNGNFICGVVEGFYGRPWTTEQRKDLFRKLKKWGMDSYVYAPKDDYKHRAYWRELYTVEEADHLTSLITAAKEQGIVFYYALSPGLDMSYSNPKEVQALKRKLEQVSQFGCDAFALLFDDIESELSKTDKEVFQTFANAQVSITNEMFSVLNNPRFLFCPTQYCSSRAVPSVVQSEYLNTLGSKLYAEIDIMWTGTKVISKNFSIESIQEITEILRRPPVIWDNLHANDYDQKRVFLGPYSGRSPELISLLRGVLTNPNCEFHANTIAIHTLASWSKCNSDAKINNSISADIKLETENDDGITNEDIPSCLSKNIYHPRYALRKSIIEWLPEFSIEKVAWGPISKPQPPVTMVMPILPIIQSINTCMSLTTTTTTTAMNSNTSKVPEMNTTQLQALADVCSTVSSVQPISNPVMNSLVSATKVVTNDEIPNPITSASVSNIEIPKNIPISASITVPIMTLKSGELKTNELPSETSNNSYENSTNNHVIDEEEEITEIEENISQEKNKDENNIPIDDDDIPIAESSSSPTIVKNAENHGKMSIQNNENNIGTINNTDVVPVSDSLQMSDNLSPLCGCTEPMECNSQASPKDIGKNSSDDVVMSETVSTGSAGSSMQIESSESLTFSQAEMVEDFDKLNDLMISVDDLYLLCDLFYLPFEHGSRGLQLLNEFNWLKTNANVLLHTSKKGEAIKPEVQEWMQRSEKFAGLCQSVISLSQKIASCVNKELSYDLFSYVWDIAGVITLLNAFVKWLALGNFPTNINSYTMGSYSWYSKGWKETFMSGEQEPWVFRGGLTADLQRLMPIDGGNDLFIYKLPDVPTTNYYSIRPYTHIDEREIKQIYQKMNIELLEQIPENLQEILFDREVNPYITLNSGMCLTIQNANNIIVGFACAAVDCRIFYRNLDICWIPEMCIKYPKTILDNVADVNYLIKDYINFFHNFKYECPQDVYSTHPSIINCCVSKEDLIIDQSIAKRLITVLLAVLRSNGSFGCHICLNENDSNNSTSNNNLIEFYTKLGFSEIYRDTITSCVYLGRNF